MKTTPHDHALPGLLRRVLPVLLVLLLLALFPRSARAQTEGLLLPEVGADTARSFAHAGLPVRQPTVVLWPALGLPALAAP